MFDEVERCLKKAGFSTGRYRRGLIWRTDEPICTIRAASVDETLVIALGQSPNKVDSRFYLGVSTNPEYFGFNAGAKARAAHAHSNLRATRQRSWKMVEEAGLASWPFEAINRGVWAHSSWINHQHENSVAACVVVMALLANPHVLTENPNSEQVKVLSKKLASINPNWTQLDIPNLLHSVLQPG